LFISVADAGTNTLQFLSERTQSGRPTALVETLEIRDRERVQLTVIVAVELGAILLRLSFQGQFSGLPTLPRMPNRLRHGVPLPEAVRDQGA
jgi:hypothetical protein